MSFFEQFRASFANSSEVYRQRREAQRMRLMANEQLKNAIETVVLFRNVCAHEQMLVKGGKSVIKRWLR